MSDQPLPEPDRRWALFLDFDGTLVDIETHPDGVRPAAHLPALLKRLSDLLGGAVAVVSGRTLASLEALLGHLDVAMAGVHGLERRGTDGRVERAVDPAGRFAATRVAVERFVAANPGTLAEDKGTSLALHYRNAPEAAAAAECLLERERRRLGEDFRLQRGKCVLELKPDGHDKGTVVAAFLEDPPFRDRTPVFIGDDVTDEDAFRVVRARGGHAIRVGDGTETAATARLATVEEVLAWLNQVARRLEERTPARQ